MKSETPKLERFNRATEEQYANYKMTVSLNKKLEVLFLAAPTRRKLGMQNHNGRIELFRLGNSWFLCVSDSESSYIVEYNSGGRVNCKIPVINIIQDYSITGPENIVHFTLTKSTHEMDGQPLYELILKPQYEKASKNPVKFS